jgi:hypothetical protein
VSNTSVKVAFAFFVVLASLAASSARDAGSVATGNMPIAKIDPSGVGKCFQGSRASAAAHSRHRPQIVHSTGVCWAPQDITEGPGV